MPRTTVLVAASAAVAVAGGALLWRGATEGPDGLTVAGILVLLAGLVGLRIGYWTVRVRAMTRAGLALHGPRAPDGGDDEP
jgi:hypothetical protein